MEEQFKHIDKKTQKLIKEAGMDMPSTNFLNNVMSVVESKVSKKEYTPLISNFSWFVIWGLLVAWVLVFYFYPSSYTSIFKDIKLNVNVSIESPFPVYSFSKTLIYGIGFLGLFLVQIPFLKRYMDKRSAG